MIIRFPTGLYQDAGQLPENPEDAGNVTFTISNEEPRRSNALVIQLPIAEEIRKRSPLVHDDETRRATFGELIFTLVDAKRTLPGSNRKTFEVGEFLNFEDEELTLPDPKAVPNQVDLQHNTNLLDLSDAGLSEDEIEDLNQKSATKKKELENQFASLQAQVSDKQIEISENQKRLNETRKLISAVSEIVASDDDLLVRLQDREEDLLAERDTLIVSTNDLNTQSKQVLDSLINVSEIVR